MKKIFINSNLKRFKEPSASRVLNNHIQVYIDLSFEKSHNRINLKSLCSQIRIGINEINKDAHENSLNVSICSLNKAPKTKSLLLQQGLKSWKQYNNKFVYDDFFGIMLSSSFFIFCGILIIDCSIYLTYSPFSSQ